jgi:hypothetical protein
MLSKSQLSGMRGVYLVAAELSRLGFIASPTSRSARGADILATDCECKRAFSIQVKTSSPSLYWLLTPHAKTTASPTHIYVFVHIKDRDPPDFYVVPSAVVARKMWIEPQKGGSVWYSFTLEDAKPFKDKWDVLGNAYSTKPVPTLASRSVLKRTRRGAAGG